VEVAQLVRLLTSLFPCRGGDGGHGGSEAEQQQTARVQPYHKSVLDWLTCSNGMDSGPFKVDAVIGHRLLARACAALTPLLRDVPEQEVPTPGAVRVGAAYCLRHAVAHAALSRDAPLLSMLLLDSEGLWGPTHAAGESTGQD
jgi:hypothetical protein